MNRWLQHLTYRSQLNILGTLMVVLLLWGISVVWSAARTTETVIVAANRSRLAESVDALKRGVERRLEFLDTEGRASPFATPDSESSRKLLTLITEMTLQSSPGVEGGFYASSGVLVGYAFPTHEGGLKTDIPEAERPVILDVAARSLRSGKPVDDQIKGVRDVILFRAIPIFHAGRREGVAWAMKRLSGVRSPEGRLSSFATLTLGLGALLCVGFAFYLAQSVHSGVEYVKAGLRQVGNDLNHRISGAGHSEEVREIAEAVNRLADQLQEQIAAQRRAEELARQADRLASLGQLVAGVAHEVRNPLATVKLRTQMLMESCASERDRESCAEILMEIQRLDGLVNKLLVFGRTFAVDPSPADLNEILLDRIRHFQDLAESLGIRLEARLSQHSVPVTVDRPKLIQVIDNLLNNAVDAVTPGQGAVEIRSGLEDQTAWFEICDNGCGISPDLLRRLFDPFVSTKDRGAGLGLSISKEIVEMHNGNITVTSTPGQGATFRILLPLAPVERDT